MTVDRMHALRSSWQGNPSIRAAVEEAFDSIGFTEGYVSGSSKLAVSSAAALKSKQIKDNQWGMVEFDGDAMRLIDSPLLQRLRRVKQLGFSYLTYPSAEHSRFIHSIGVAHVITRFLDAIRRRAQEGGGESQGIEFVAFDKLAGLDERDLVHAALLHDIGHLPFSHVTEKVIEARAGEFRCGSVGADKIRAEVALRLKKNLGFAEILSLLFILSDRFGRYYVDAIRRDAKARDSLLNIACLVAGIPPNEHLTGIPQLLSASAVDADKVDYINRDARNCGIPVGVDVARVFLRSGIVKVERDKIIELGLKPNPASHEFFFVINSSGLDTIDEILLARTALYQRVYFHSVTRAAERLLAGC